MRILITGPECSGKSTLAAELSKQLGIPWFPEYGRTYLEKYGPDYDQSDILKIAKGYQTLVDTFPPDQSLILDTYLLNLKIWTEMKYAQKETWIDSQLKTEQPFDYIFLLAPNLPWKQDGLRENEENRTAIFDRFLLEMNNLAWDYRIIEEIGEQRIESILGFMRS